MLNAAPVETHPMTDAEYPFNVDAMYERWASELLKPEPERDAALIASIEAVAERDGWDVREYAEFRHTRNRRALTTRSLAASLGLTAAGDWDPDLHPRGKNGKFIVKMGFVTGMFGERGKLGRRKEARAQVLEIKPDPKTPGNPDLEIEVLDSDGNPVGRQTVKAKDVSDANPTKAELDLAKRAPAEPANPRREMGSDEWTSIVSDIVDEIVSSQPERYDPDANDFSEVTAREAAKHATGTFMEKYEGNVGFDTDLEDEVLEELKKRAKGAAKKRGEKYDPVTAAGRSWNPDLHPRGKDGKFIVKFGFITGMFSALGKGGELKEGRGRVVDIKPNASRPGNPDIHVEVFNRNGKPLGIEVVEAKSVSAAPVSKARLGKLDADELAATEAVPGQMKSMERDFGEGRPDALSGVDLDAVAKTDPADLERGDLIKRRVRLPPGPDGEQRTGEAVYRVTDVPTKGPEDDDPYSIPAELVGVHGSDGVWTDTLVGPDGEMTAGDSTNLPAGHLGGEQGHVQVDRMDSEPDNFEQGFPAEDTNVPELGDEELDAPLETVTVDGKQYELIDGGAQSNFWLDPETDEEVDDPDLLERLDDEVDGGAAAPAAEGPLEIKWGPTTGPREGRVANIGNSEYQVFVSEDKDGRFKASARVGLQYIHANEAPADVRDRVDEANAQFDPAGYGSIDEGVAEVERVFGGGGGATPDPISNPTAPTGPAISDETLEAGVRSDLQYQSQSAIDALGEELPQSPERDAFIDALRDVDGATVGGRADEIHEALVNAQEARDALLDSEDGESLTDHFDFLDALKNGIERDFSAQAPPDAVLPDRGVPEFEPLPEGVADGPEVNLPDRSGAPRTESLTPEEVDFFVERFGADRSLIEESTQYETALYWMNRGVDPEASGEAWGQGLDLGAKNTVATALAMHYEDGNRDGALEYLANNAIRDRKDGAAPADIPATRGEIPGDSLQPTQGEIPGDTPAPGSVADIERRIGELEGSDEQRQLDQAVPDDVDGAPEVDELADLRQQLEDLESTSVTGTDDRDYFRNEDGDWVDENGALASDPAALGLEDAPESQDRFFTGPEDDSAPVPESEGEDRFFAGPEDEDLGGYFETDISEYGLDELVSDAESRIVELDNLLANDGDPAEIEGLRDEIRQLEREYDETLDQMDVEGAPMELAPSFPTYFGIGDGDDGGGEEIDPWTGEPINRDGEATVSGDEPIFLTDDSGGRVSEGDDGVPDDLIEQWMTYGMFDGRGYIFDANHDPADRERTVRQLTERNMRDGGLDPTPEEVDRVTQRIIDARMASRAEQDAELTRELEERYRDIEENQKPFEKLKKGDRAIIMEGGEAVEFRVTGRKGDRVFGHTVRREDFGQNPSDETYYDDGITANDLRVNSGGGTSAPPEWDGGDEVQYDADRSVFVDANGNELDADTVAEYGLDPTQIENGGVAPTGMKTYEGSEAAALRDQAAAQIDADDAALEAEDVDAPPVDEGVDAPLEVPDFEPRDWKSTWQNAAELDAHIAGLSPEQRVAEFDANAGVAGAPSIRSRAKKMDDASLEATFNASGTATDDTRRELKIEMARRGLLEAEDTSGGPTEPDAPDATGATTDAPPAPDAPAESRVPPVTSFADYKPGGPLTLVKTGGTKEGRNEEFDVYDENGYKVGTIRASLGYKDTKAPGSKIVTSRKNVTRWSFQVDPEFLKAAGITDYNERKKYQSSPGLYSDTRKDAAQQMWAKLDTDDGNIYAKGATLPWQAPAPTAKKSPPPLKPTTPAPSAPSAPASSGSSTPSVPRLSKSELDSRISDFESDMGPDLQGYKVRNLIDTRRNTIRSGVEFALEGIRDFGDDPAQATVTVKPPSGTEVEIPLDVVVAVARELNIPLPPGV